MLHKQEMNLAQQDTSIKSRASKFSSAKYKIITHDLATTSRRKKAVLVKLIQGDPKQPKHVANIYFSIKLHQAILNARG